MSEYHEIPAIDWADDAKQDDAAGIALRAAKMRMYDEKIRIAEMEAALANAAPPVNFIP